MTTKSLADRFAILIGAFLLIEGIWELFSPIVFGVLSSNTLHGVIHIALGLVGFWLGWQARARLYCIFLGILLLVVGSLWFIPSARELPVRLFNVNQPVELMNLIVGAISLLLAFASKREAVRTS